MHTHFWRHDLLTAPNKRFFCYVSCSTFGILLGVLFHLVLKGDAFSFLSFVEIEPHFFSVYFSMIFPLLVTVICLSISAYKLFAFYFFIESFCRGFCGMLLIRSLGSGSWLIRPLLMFSGSIVSVFLFWLIIRHENHKQSFFLKDVLASIVTLCIASIFDLFILFPFCSSLFK